MGSLSITFCSLISAESIVNFPSVRPSKSTPFTIYCRDTASTFDLTKRLTLIAGETEDVEFFSTNRHQPSSTDGADCSYVLGP